MTSIGTGYDLSASTYSPDGRIFQVWLAPDALWRALTFASPCKGRIRQQGSRELWVRIGFFSFAWHSLTTQCYNSTAIGLRVKDGVVLAVEKIIHSKLLVPEANRRIQTIDKHIGLVRYYDAAHHVQCTEVPCRPLQDF